MNKWFYFLSILISLIFLICFVVIFYCSLNIYLNVEKTMTHNKAKNTTKKDWYVWIFTNSNPYFYLVIFINQSVYLDWCNCVLDEAQ